MPKVYGVVTARGGSKGVPGKNIRVVAGKPLVAWTIEAARQAKRLAGVYLSTDDPAIAQIGREWGAEVPFLRPAELAQDQSSHISVVLHALDWFEANGGLPDFVCLLQPTSPLRTADDIDAVIELARAKDAIAVVSVTEAKPHPCKTFGLTASGTLVDFVRSEIAYRRRQDLPLAYAENGALYLNRTESLRCDRTYVPSGTVPYVMPLSRSLDIDSEWDFEMAEWILSRRSAATDSAPAAPVEP